MAARRRNQSSDLAARVLAAIPAIAFAVAIVVAGKWVFTAALILLGWVCLHEAFAMLAAAHPVRLAGFLGFAGMLVAAHLGGPDAVLGALAATVPLTFVIALVQPRAGAPGLAVTAFICHVGYEVTADVVRRLADGIDPSVITGAEAAAGSVPGVIHAHARARWTGRTLRMEIEG